MAMSVIQQITCSWTLELMLLSVLPMVVAFLALKKQEEMKEMSIVSTLMSGEHSVLHFIVSLEGVKIHLLLDEERVI